MTERESKLIHRVMVEAGYDTSDRRKLGNGDWVIVINGIHLWGRSDWYAFKERRLPGVPRRWYPQEQEVSV